MNDEYDTRLADLEARVHALESARPAETPTADVGESIGQIGYQGTVDLGGEIQWTIRYDAGATLDLSPTAVSNVLAALGHPTRLEIVRTLLRGPAGAAELQTAVGLSSPGQLYHHLRVLGGARIVEQESRNHYRIAAAKVVPLLVITLAAADVGEHPL